MRQVGDPPGDEVVDRIYSTGGVQAVNALMSGFVRNDQMDPRALPDDVREFISATAVLPPWADPNLIQAGESLFWEFGAPMITALFCDSLPFCYLGRKGVQVLALTARLYTNPTRRVLETAQFLVDTLQRGGLSPQGGGIRAAQKVRMMHAAIRLQIRESGKWSPAFDLPINQEDMAGTLMSFSSVLLDGLARLGFSTTPQQQEAYLHCWKVTGHILGVREELLPVDIDAARDLAGTIMRRQAGDCPEGRMMTSALVGMMQQHTPLHLFQHVPATLIRHLLGDDRADLLGVESERWDEAILACAEFLDKGIDHVTEHSKLIAGLNGFFARHLVQGVILIDRGGNRPSFRLPDELRGKWGIG
jgi:mpaB/rubber oxygenase-like protein